MMNTAVQHALGLARVAPHDFPPIGFPQNGAQAGRAVVPGVGQRTFGLGESELVLAEQGVEFGVCVLVHSVAVRS